MKLLLLSNSTNPGESYLGYPKGEIKKFLSGHNLDSIVFIPYAAIRFSYDEYESKVNNSLSEIGITVKGIHKYDDPVEAIENASVIMIGGGNTWKLTRILHDNNLMPAIKNKVLHGTPYIGWSAGSNVACPTLKTTNDMPVIDPKGFDTINLVPFQINPHYLDTNPKDHGGETREERILEFIEENKNTFVIGLRESTILHYNDGKLNLIGTHTARIFKWGSEPKELKSSDDFNFLLS